MELGWLAQRRRPPISSLPPFFQLFMRGGWSFVRPSVRCWGGGRNIETTCTSPSLVPATAAAASRQPQPRPPTPTTPLEAIVMVMAPSCTTRSHRRKNRKRPQQPRREERKREEEAHQHHQSQWRQPGRRPPRLFRKNACALYCMYYVFVRPRWPRALSRALWSCLAASLSKEAAAAASEAAAAKGSFHGNMTTDREKREEGERESTNKQQSGGARST